jgi:hypothetical protein
MRYNVAVKRCLLLVAAVVTLAACEASEGEEPMGSGGLCEERLAAVVDERDLLDEGVEIREDEAVEDQIADAIEAVCDEGPASMSIGAARARVVSLIRARTTSH